MSSDAPMPRMPSAVRELQMLLLPIAQNIDRSWRPRQEKRDGLEDLPAPSRHRRALTENSLTLSSRMFRLTFFATKTKPEVYGYKRAVRIVERAYVALKHRRVRTWQKIHEDMCNAERAYIESLTTLLDCYAAPMQERDVLSPMQQAVLFCNIRLIRDFHKGLLDRFVVSSRPRSIMSCFNDIIAFLPHYSVYINNYSNALRVLTVARRDPSFKRFSQAIIIPDKLGVFPDINCFLIMPLQKVARYQLFMSRFIKVLPHCARPLKDMTAVLELLRQRTAELDLMSSDSPSAVDQDAARTKMPQRLFRPVQKAVLRCKEFVRTHSVIVRNNHGGTATA